MAQNDNNMGVLVALVGIAVAAVALLAGGGSSSRPVSRDEVMEDFRPSLLEELQRAATSATSSTSSSTSTSDVTEHIERTGLLPSGNDVASRISLISQDEFQEDYETGDGAVGL